jgi:N-acetyl sugar amidotransferase
MTDKVCTFCVMDSSNPGIEFDANGRCNCCRDAEARKSFEWWPNDEGQSRLKSMIDQLRISGVGKPYDAMIGLSGGIDSAYLAHLAVKMWGLRVLAVHVDGGWNSEPAVRNIESMVRKLDIDLFTHVVEWEEMKDLQLSFMRASVLNQDIPQDHAFFSTLYRTATKFGMRDFLSGVNFSTECVVPPGFGFPYSDDVQLRSIHKRFGCSELNSYPTMRFVEFLWITRVRKQLSVHKPLNYIDYDKERAGIELTRYYDWRDYGSKHSESRFTKFYQDIYLPRKANFDKRKLHLSSLIVSGQMSRAEALVELSQLNTTENQVRQDVKFIAKKLGISQSELEHIISSPLIPHSAYPNQQGLAKALLKVRQLARRFLVRIG